MKLLNGKYQVVETYAAPSMSEEEYQAHQYDEEQHVMMVAVRSDFLERYTTEQGFSSVKEFLMEYTYDDVDGFEVEAEACGAFAFAYRPTLEKKYLFPDNPTAETFEALREFVAAESIFELILTKLPKAPTSDKAVFSRKGSLFCPDGVDAQVVMDFLSSMDIACTSHYSQKYRLTKITDKLGYACKPTVTDLPPIPKTPTVEDCENMVDYMARYSLYRRILEALPDQQVAGKPFFTNGCDIICADEKSANVIADLFEATDCILPTTGYFDPEEDKRNDEVDALTGLYYVSC